MNKKQLYESIMASVATEVKKALVNTDYPVIEITKELSEKLKYDSRNDLFRINRGFGNPKKSFGVDYEEPFIMAGHECILVKGPDGWIYDFIIEYDTKTINDINEFNQLEKSPSKFGYPSVDDIVGAPQDQQVCYNPNKNDIMKYVNTGDGRGVRWIYYTPPIRKKDRMNDIKIAKLMARRQYDGIDDKIRKLYDDTRQIGDDLSTIKNRYERDNANRRRENSATSTASDNQSSRQSSMSPDMTRWLRGRVMSQGDYSSTPYVNRDW